MYILYVIKSLHVHSCTNQERKVQRADFLTMIILIIVAAVVSTPIKLVIMIIIIFLWS